ncbi:hypothetical protein FACS1894152_6740 [Bacilli bacterium]|nr:hypothetical protein FACS1894152_6740 [Bacilli bacterium]
MNGIKDEFFGIILYLVVVMLFCSSTVVRADEPCRNLWKGGDGETICMDKSAEEKNDGEGEGHTVIEDIVANFYDGIYEEVKGLKQDESPEKIRKRAMMFIPFGEESERGGTTDGNGERKYVSDLLIAVGNEIVGYIRRLEKDKNKEDHDELDSYNLKIQLLKKFRDDFNSIHERIIEMKIGYGFATRGGHWRIAERRVSETAKQDFLKEFAHYEDTLAAFHRLREYYCDAGSSGTECVDSFLELTSLDPEASRKLVEILTEKYGSFIKSYNDAYDKTTNGYNDAVLRSLISNSRNSFLNLFGGTSENIGSEYWVKINYGGQRNKKSNDSDRYGFYSGFRLLNDDAGKGKHTLGLAIGINGIKTASSETVDYKLDGFTFNLGLYDRYGMLNDLLYFDTVLYYGHNRYEEKGSIGKVCGLTIADRTLVDMLRLVNVKFKDTDEGRNKNVNVEYMSNDVGIGFGLGCKFKFSEIVSLIPDLHFDYVSSSIAKREDEKSGNKFKSKTIGCFYIVPSLRLEANLLSKLNTGLFVKYNKSIMDSNLNKSSFETGIDLSLNLYKGLKFGLGYVIAKIEDRKNADHNFDLQFVYRF